MDSNQIEALADRHFDEFYWSVVDRETHANRTNFIGYFWNLGRYAIRSYRFGRKNLRTRGEHEVYRSRMRLNFKWAFGER